MKDSESSSLTDEEVIARLASGESSRFFEVLYERYIDKVTNKCYNLLKDRKLSREFAEDIFSKVYERLHSFEGKSSFSTWLYSITYNHCIDYLRKKKNLHYPKWNLEQVAMDIPVEETEPEDISFDKLNQVLEMLHPEEKALLYMKYMDGMSLKQISEALRISETVTKMRLKRARTRVLFLYKKTFFSDLL